MTTAQDIERENAELRQRVGAAEARLAWLSSEVTPEQRDALQAAQVRADSVGALFGQRVSEPRLGETPLSYRRRVLRDFQVHSPQLQHAQLDAMNDATLGLVENQVYADAAVAARTAAEAKPGVLTPYVEIDAAGRRITKFYGDPMAWMAPFMTGGSRGRFNRG